MEEQKFQLVSSYEPTGDQPEAYVPGTDTYIEKDSAINDEIDKLRHSATSAIAEDRDVIVVSSVSCIYPLGNPIDYKKWPSPSALFRRSSL